MALIRPASVAEEVMPRTWAVGRRAVVAIVGGWLLTAESAAVVCSFEYSFLTYGRFVLGAVVRSLGFGIGHGGDGDDFVTMVRDGSFGRRGLKGQCRLSSQQIYVGASNCCVISTRSFGPRGGVQHSGRSFGDSENREQPW